MIKQTLFVPLAGCLLALACAQANAAPNPYSNFIVFGDSLNDAGTFADTGGPAGSTERYTNRTGPVYQDGSGELYSLNSTQLLGGRLGFSPDQTASSSSAVRAALLEADLGHAARLLGRPYSIAGRVSHGDKLGRQLGFPTANIQMKHRRPALTGVYAVSVEGLGVQRIAGVANVGVRPTATSGGRARLEVHLFDWTQNCYGAHIRVNFLHKLRDEHKFESLDALRAQIALDAQTARDWFVSHPTSLIESA